jgi:hypothetical protein
MGSFFYCHIERRCNIIFSIVIHSEKENLCLYGLPNETWEVNLPVEEVPPDLKQLNDIYRDKTEEYSHTALNV